MPLGIAVSLLPPGIAVDFLTPSKGEESRQAWAWLKIPATRSQKNQTTQQSAFI